ncbi:molybdenum cofactor biosynthesis protein MoaE [Cyanobium sp. Morenito 9A2]|uniref:molybdopterin synthase catalytic subunit n=1 Tax=Cyanobium sp. Morenito 9A2 TaxID=2823718 RepID=UPI0020CD7AFC|nr:molybdenum cofactor biosynthesis protein MoaE [Cyanobium sp. Morenito 9A2]MCP9848910.1 molybdenum cofactor biosynthesis protein MoaE [Cyanobium sp. Morenito 9A2]
MDLPAELLISLHPEPFEPLELLAAWELAAQALAPLAAAESHFIGRVRPVAADGTALEALELEHYPGMSERRLQDLAQELAERHGVSRVRLAHRVGRVRPSEAIVLVTVAADRRGPAQRCAQELLEALKHEAPFWKREWSGGVGTWVEGNTPF